MSDAMSDFFTALAGKELDGSCDRCDAYQTVETVSPGMHMIRVHHDDWCPFLRAMNAETN
jgi:hypothetical protein